MSRHKSFGKSSGTAAKKNVLKRFDRIAILEKLGRWDLEKQKKVTGLPKTPVL